MSERKVAPTELAPGMVLAEPIMHPYTRQVIWMSGTTLTAQHVLLLQQMDLKHLRVLDLGFVPPPEAPGAPGSTVPAPRRTPAPSASGATVSGATHMAPRPRAEAPSARGVPFRPQTIRTEVMERNVQTIRQIQQQIKSSTRLDIQAVDQSVQATIQKIVANQELLHSLIDLRVYDEYTYAHSSNVMSLALVVGAAMGYSIERLRILGIGALLHDIGKSMVPESILHKPGRLTKEEFNLMATHPANGIMLLAGYSWAIPEIKNIVFQHHEKFDGSGYPMRLSGAAISEMARIVSVVDVYDALISNRPYKKGLPPNVVYQAILDGARNHFDPRIVSAFTTFIVPYPVDSLVVLNTGQVARVARVARHQLMRPVIELEGQLIDLARNDRYAIVTMHQPEAR